MQGRRSRACRRGASWKDLHFAVFEKPALPDQPGQRSGRAGSVRPGGPEDAAKVLCTALFERLRLEEARGR